MRTAAICPTCATYYNAVCILYDGPGLANIPAAPLDNLDTILVALNGTIGGINTSITTINTNITNINNTLSNFGLQEVLNIGNSAVNKSIILNNNTFYYTGGGNGNLLLGTPFTTSVGSNNIYIGNTGFGNTGDSVLAMGLNAAENNSGTGVIAIGGAAAINNTKNNVVAVGANAANNNSGAEVSAVGVGAALGNTKDGVVGVGFDAARQNSGNYVVAIGHSAGYPNTYNNVNLIGQNAQATGNNQTVLAGATNQILINHNSITADRAYTAPNANGTLVLSVNGTAADATGNVTLTPPYKVFTAVISQAGTNPPTVNYILQNTLGFVPAWGYNNVGRYEIIAPALDWVASKVVVFINPGYPALGVITGWERNSDTIMTIHTQSTSPVNPFDPWQNDLLFNATIEVRIYP